MDMAVRGIRGAITVDEDDAQQIRDATRELVEEILKRNEISDYDNVISATFTTTEDLCAAFPAEAARHIGMSLVPLLRDPSQEWRFAVLTTYARENHALRSERYRYLRMEDGTEEFYDHQTDPNEWTNLAAKKELAPLKEELAKWLPKTNADPAKGGTARKRKRPGQKAD